MCFGGKFRPPERVGRTPFPACIQGLVPIWGQALFACRGGGVGAVRHCGEEAGASCCSGCGRAKAWGLPELPDVTLRPADSLARTRYTINLS